MRLTKSRSHPKRVIACSTALQLAITRQQVRKYTDITRSRKERERYNPHGQNIERYIRAGMDTPKTANEECSWHNFHRQDFDRDTSCS
jgi:hypothetical protein